MGGAERPRHVEILNRLSLNESAAGRWMAAWLTATRDPEVRILLQEVGANETEHGLTLARRIVELGFELEPPDDKTANAHSNYLALAGSQASDREKFEAFGWADLKHGDPAFPDATEGLLDQDRTMDPWTAAVLGRYIAEDRAIARRIREVFLRKYGTTDKERDMAQAEGEARSPE
jgi:hypothetical protein